MTYRLSEKDRRTIDAVRARLEGKPAPQPTVQLIGWGRAPAITWDAVEIGQRVMFNYGATYEVTSKVRKGQVSWDVTLKGTGGQVWSATKRGSSEIGLAR